jgi:cell division protein FtsB
MIVSVKKALWVSGFILLVIILYLPGYTKIQELRDRNVDLQKKIKRLYIENSLLQQEITRIENDPVYQERLARDKMGVVRKGEVPVKIVMPEEQAQ